MHFTRDQVFRHNKNEGAERNHHKYLIQALRLIDVERSVICPKSGNQKVLKSSLLTPKTMTVPFVHIHSLAGK